MLLKTPQEEEQLQPAKHKQPGAQHHTDKREASGQQVGSPDFFVLLEILNSIRVTTAFFFF